jgi:recombination associated protein RdgC
MDFLDILREKAFLGREFLTWLWYKSEQTGGRIQISGSRTIETIFLDRMTLDLTDSDSPQTVAIKGEHSELREGLAALREGKKIEEARISIRGGDNDFSFILKGTWFAFGSFKTPPVLPVSEQDVEEGPEARFLEKISLIEEGMELVDALFESFLEIRTSPAWESEELPELRRWVEAAGE